MIEPALRRQLEPVARRLRTERLHRRMIRLWVVLGAVALVAMTLQVMSGVSFGAVVPFVMLVGVLGGLFMAFANELWQPDYREVARRIEALDPDFKSLLSTAVEQQPDPATGKFTFLQARVIRQAVEACSQRDWNKAALGFALGGVRFGNVVALAAVVALTWLLYSNGALPGGNSVALIVDGYEVTPGDTRVEKGSSLVVLARFSGRVPNEAALVVEQGGRTNRIALSRSLNDPVFGGTVREVQTDGVYWIEFGSKTSRSYKLGVFEFPRLEKSDAEIEYPSYTKLDPKKVPDTRRVSVVEGSKVKIELLLNKPVRSAQLIGQEGTINLELPAGRAAALLPSLVLTQSQTMRLLLVDAEGLTNKLPTQFVLDALPNRPPALKWISPKGDQRVSALQEMNFSAEASDDFGLVGYGFNFIMPDGSTKEIRVAGTGNTNDLKVVVPPNEKKTFEHLLALEGIPASVDDLLTYHVWAEDIGPDGQLRRTQGDLFLSEVRPFEEIFRKGQPQDPQQQQQQQGNEATKLADLQKQVLNATWKLQRQLGGTRLPAGFKTNLSVIVQSQNKALEMAEAMKEKVQDPRGQSFLDLAMKQMERAVKELEAADKNPFRLSEATTAENAAYSALLKLSARETQVTQQRGGGGGGGGGKQQQLDQLEMNEKENRYETKSQAQQAQTPEQKEQLEFLNRLKDLAQRQQDINDRLKEMQNSLEAAKTEEEKENLRRELKRLREEQRELLADADDARQKMERNDKNGELAQERERLNDTRRDMEKASDSLNQDKVSDALASGSRVERDLKNLQDEVRKKTSSQFADAMRDIREEARKLAENQKELGDKLRSDPKAQRRTLSSEPVEDKVAEQLAQQKAALTNLLGSMTQVSQQAEASEPLLSKRLYDMIRQQSLNNTEESLDKARLLAERSLNREAAQFEQAARNDIDKLRQGVEQAAESVLGDEAQALERARKELDDLANQLNRELASRGGGSQQGTNGNGGFLRDNMDQAGSTNRSGMARSGGSTNGVGRMASNNRNGQRQPGQGEQANQPGGQQGDQQQPGSEAQQGRQPGNQGKQGQKGKQGPGKQGERGQNGQGGQQPGQGQNGEQGQQPGEGQQPGQGQGGQQPGQEGQQGQQGQAGQGGRGGQRNQPGSRQNPQQRQGQREGSTGTFDIGSALGGGGADYGTAGGPLTGDNYREWNDRLGNVEEMVGDARLREDIAQIRDRVRAVRGEFRRGGREPQWNLVRAQILQPLAEVQNRIAEELAKRGSREALVPIDRDPVPAQFTEQVRRYYEQLGRDN